MSDRVRQGAGIMLMMGGILLCLIPAFSPVTGEEIRYRSGTVQEWGISRIETILHKKMKYLYLVLILIFLVFCLNKDEML